MPHWRHKCGESLTLAPTMGHKPRRRIQSTVPPACTMWQYCMLDALSLPILPPSHLPLFSLVLASLCLRQNQPTLHLVHLSYLCMVSLACRHLRPRCLCQPPLFSLVSLAWRHLYLGQLPLFSRSVAPEGICTQACLFYLCRECSCHLRLAHQNVASRKRCAASKRRSA